MSYTSTTSVGTGSLTTLYDKSVDGIGPVEWELTPDKDITLRFTGVFPGPDTDVDVAADETYRFGSISHGITKIEAEAVSTTASVVLRPSVWA